MTELIERGALANAAGERVLYLNELTDIEEELANALSGALGRAELIPLQAELIPLQTAPEIRWHDITEDPEDLPENGQWCAIVYTGITRYDSGLLARYYDGNPETAWHEWLAELMPGKGFYVTITGGGISQNYNGLPAVRGWLPIPMDERYFE